MIMYYPTSLVKVLSHYFIFQEMVQLAPHSWRHSYHTKLYFTPCNISAVVPFCLCPNPPLEILIIQHTSPRLSLALLILQKYCSKPPYGFDINKFLNEYFFTINNLGLQPRDHFYLYFIHHKRLRQSLPQTEEPIYFGIVVCYWQKSKEETIS